MTTEQDERRLAEIREFVSPADTVTDRVFLLQMIDQANERTVRLERLLNAAPTLSKYHGQSGFEIERFIADYEVWRTKCRTVLSQGGTMTPDERALLLTLARLTKERISDEIELARHFQKPSPRDDADFEAIREAMKPFETSASDATTPTGKGETR
jgi:hypothetical protein